MIVQFSVVPIGSGVSVSDRVAEAVRLVADSGLPYRVTPMGTIVEGTWAEVMRLVRRCHAAVMRHEERVITSITIDDRKGKKQRITMKVRSLERRLGRRLKQ